MFFLDILITYDVNTTTKEGRKRLRHVATACLSYGQRVQKSVFECSVNEVNYEILRSRLLDIMSKNEDSIRIYKFRGSRNDSVESFGIDTYIDFNNPLII